MTLLHLLGVAWALLDGRLASQGAPSITTLTPRRALNVVYAMAIENMSSEERDEFESKLNLSMVDLQREHVKELQDEKRSRIQLAMEFGEVG